MQFNNSHNFVFNKFMSHFIILKQEIGCYFEPFYFVFKN
tara:strand:- start:397 stop:513 length:117 start_codon:yes stop_codon:yes gene_type:complete